MPVVAVIGAVAASAVAASAVATAGITLVSSLAVVGAVGATIGAIGVLTKNQALSEAGLALGVVGGVGSLAANAGLFGADASTAPLFGTQVAPSAADQAANAGAAADLTSDAGIGTGGTDLAGITNAGSQSDIVDSLGGITSATTDPANSIATSIGADAGNAADIVPNPVTGNLGAASAPAGDAGLGSGGITTASQSAPGAGIALPGQTGDTLPPVQAEIASGAGTAPTVPGATAPAAPAAPSALSNILGFEKSSGGGLATLGLLQAGGSLLAGATNPLTPAQVAQANGQAAENQAQAGLTNLQVSNLQQPLPVAMPTTTAAPASTALPAGLINTPVKTAPVTGVPAT